MWYTGNVVLDWKLAAEHFINADESILLIISILFNTFLNHGHLPDDFVKSPIVKNNTGDTSDSSNYKPIALVTAMSKLCESVWLTSLYSYVYICHQISY